MTTTGLIHIIFGSIALFFGLLVVMLPKGTRLHRTVGHLYFSAMIGLNLTALSLYRLFKTVGPFHILALVSLGYVLTGVWYAIRQTPRQTWLSKHIRFMSWSYVGLLAAATAEIACRIPGTNFWLAVLIPSCLVSVLGWYIIENKAVVLKTQLP
ncbi:MAG TPA: DUF2306 domain-containing protein [Acidobacteriota bacterium]|nr:DUF2306 domain-containing protein [Acidobacteriota bacterium]